MRRDSTRADSTSLSPLESAALELILDRDGPGFAELRQQLDGARVIDREFTGVGFYTSIAPNPRAPRSTYRERHVNAAELDGLDVGAELDGLHRGAGFILWLEEGRIDTLEGYSYDEPWPEEISTFRVFHAEINKTVVEPNS